MGVNGTIGIYWRLIRCPAIQGRQMFGQAEVNNPG